MPEVKMPKTEDCRHRRLRGDCDPAGARNGPAAPRSPAQRRAEPPAPCRRPAEVVGSPDWPCVQRKVETISSAQVWDGPPCPKRKDWQNDNKIRELTSILESRRVPARGRREGDQGICAGAAGGRARPEAHATVCERAGEDQFRPQVRHRAGRGVPEAAEGTRGRARA